MSLDEPDSSINLADQLELQVTITPHGYVGPVELELLGFTAGITAELDAPSVTLDGEADVTTTLTLTTVSSTPPGDTTFQVRGTVGGGSQSVEGTVTVISDITIIIPKGVNAMQGTVETPYTLAFGDYPIHIAQPVGGISLEHPVTVRFFNADDVPHRLHAAQENEGFAHDPIDIAPGAMDALVRELNTATTYDWYLHDQGDAVVVGRIVVE